MAIKVLLVEDDRALREALADTLLLAGHDYRAVGSAEDALDAVEQETFSLVVSDVNMPGMDGHQLLGLAARAPAATAGVADDRSRRGGACGGRDAPRRGGLPGQAVRTQGA